MATLGRDHSNSPTRKRRGSFARRLERCCCNTLKYFPLVFVYGLDTWAVWVGVSVGFAPYKGRWSNPATSFVIFLLYALANISYTIAVFTDPGSPLNSTSGSTGYSTLPTHELDAQTSSNFTSLTAKSSGQPRFCKKCQCPKPDRAHHCSTCGRCVLKMDHHCPWLATCVGFRNYKAFILFLVYISIFCIVCFLVTAAWVWGEIAESNSLEHGSMTVNIILLAVLAGIIGLVLSGFTGWHLYLAMSGQTTIECLEKTRYLSPVKKSMEQQLQRAGHRADGGQGEYEQEEPLLDQLKEIHANALPGVTRPEEGEERISNGSTPTPSASQLHSPARDALRRSYQELEQQREQDRYMQYLDEQDSEKLPNAFDLGWRRNLARIFGSNMLLWFLPVYTTQGDGWKWEVSEDWIAKRDQISRERSDYHQTAQQRWQNGHANGFGMQASNRSLGAGRHYPDPPSSRAQPSRYKQPHPGVPLNTFDKPSHEADDYDTSSDEEPRRHPRFARGNGASASNWNDIPADMIAGRASGPQSGGARGQRSSHTSSNSSQGRQKGD